MGSLARGRRERHRTRCGPRFRLRPDHSGRGNRGGRLGHRGGRGRLGHRGRTAARRLRPPPRPASLHASPVESPNSCDGHARSLPNAIPSVLPRVPESPHPSTSSEMAPGPSDGRAAHFYLWARPFPARLLHRPSVSWCTLANSGKGHTLKTQGATVTDSAGACPDGRCAALREAGNARG